MKKIFNTPWFPALLALVLMAPLIAAEDIPLRDTLNRYAPMAQAMLDGNWGEAFHPRIPFLFPLLTAICSAGGLWSCFLGAKIASALCMAAATFPLWDIFRRAYSERIARIGCLFFAICSYWLRVGAGGTRESLKMLFLLIAADGLLRLVLDRKAWRGYWLLGAGCGAMVLVRDDSLLIGALLGVTALVLEIAGTRAFPRRTLLAGLLGLCILLPGVFINYEMTGYPVVSFRFVGMTARFIPAQMFGKLTALPLVQSGGSAVPEGSLVQAPPAAGEHAAVVVQATAQAAEEEPFIRIDGEIMLDFIDSLGKGLYFFFMIPALFVIVWRMRRREWSTADNVLLAVWLGHTLAIILQILIADRYLYTSRRYLLPAAPLAFGWTAMAGAAICDAIRRKCAPRAARIWVNALMLLLAAGLYVDAWMPQFRQLYQPKHRESRAAVRAWSRRIKAEYHGPAHQRNPVPRLKNYNTFRRPVVVCELLPETGYLAGGEGVELSPETALACGLAADYMVGAPRRNGEVPVYPGYRLIDRRDGKKRSYLLWERVEKGL